MDDSDLNIGERRRGSSQNSDDDRQGRERERERLNREDRPSRFSERTPSPRAAADRDRDRDHGNSSARPSERRVFVSNIPYEYRWQDLKDLFRTHVGEVSYVELFYDEAEKPRGCGIVEFDSINLVNKAVEKMHRFDLNSRKLVVKEDFGTARDKCGRLIKPGGGGMGGGGGGGGDHMRGGPRKDMMGLRGGGGGGGGGGGRQWDNPQGGMNQGQPQKWGDTYGLSPQFLESLWISPPLVCRVFVANLDYKVDSNKLKEVFKLAGKVQSAEVSLDKEGKSRGFGVVEYDHPVEAVQAISMLHNQMLFDRRMTVRMDRAENKLEGPPKLPEGLRGVGMGLGSGGNPLRDVSRNLPSLTQGPGAGQGQMPQPAPNIPTGLGGLGNATGLGNAGLAGLGGLNAASILGANISAADLAALANAGALSSLGMGALTGGLGTANAAAGGAGGLGGNPFGGGGLAGVNSANFLGGGGGGNVNQASMLSNALGNSGRDFDSLSAALGGGGGGGGGGMGMRGGYGGESSERDFRGAPAGGGANFANGQSRAPMGGGSGPNAGGATGQSKSDTIVVRNLPPTVTWQMLRDKYNSVGEVKFAELRGKDMGLIRFNSEWDAERAVRLTDRTRYEGRTVDVCLY